MENIEDSPDKKLEELEKQLKEIYENRAAQNTIHYKIGQLNATITATGDQIKSFTYVDENRRPSPPKVRELIEKYGELKDPAHDDIRRRALESELNLIPMGIVKSGVSFFSKQPSQETVESPRPGNNKK